MDLMIKFFAKILREDLITLKKHLVVSVGIVLAPQAQTHFPSTALTHTKQCSKTSVDHFKQKWRNINPCIPHIPPLFWADCHLLFFAYKTPGQASCFLGIYNSFLLCIVISF
jgi:hypothetical protein